MYFKVLYFFYKMYCFIFRPIRMGVRVVLQEGPNVWLIRHTYLSGWYLPGGGIKKWESLEKAARREAYEETGAELGKLSLLGTFSSFIQWKTDHTVVFLCQDFIFTGASDGEIAELKLFALSALPENTFPSHRSLLNKLNSKDQIPAFGEW